MQGADVPAYERQPPVVGRVLDGSPAERGGHPARRPHRQRRRRAAWTPGSSSSWRSAARRARGRDRDRRARRAAPRGRCTVDADAADAGSRSATSACCPTCIRSIASRAARASRPSRPASRPATSILAVNGDRTVVSGAGVERDREARRDSRSRSRSGATAQSSTSTVTPARDGDVGRHRRRASATTTLRRSSPARSRRSSMSVRAELAVGRPDLPDARRACSRGETSPKQLMGPVGIAQLSGERRRPAGSRSSA